MATVRPAVVATLVAATTLIAAFASDVLYTQWRVNWALTSIRIGDTRSHVRAILGEPDSGPLMSLGSCSNADATCDSWNLVHENYLTVCYDKTGRVICRQKSSLWY